MYRLLGRKDIRRSDEFIKPGDEFEPTEAELQAFGDKLEKVESDETHDDTEESDEDETNSDEDDSETYTCAGKDGECSREVDEAGQRCWQHQKSDG